MVLFDQNQSTSLVLNPTGAHIWELLTVGKRADELVSIIQSEYPEKAGDQQIATDVATYLAELLEHGVISTDSPQRS